MSLAHIFAIETFTIAWGGLAIVIGFFTLASIAFRVRPQRKSGVTIYDPPKDLSPALAAFLFEDGRHERAFAAALVSLAAKGYLKTSLQTGNFIFERLRDSDAELPRSEATILESLFPDTVRSYVFSAADCAKLCETYRTFQNTLEDDTRQELISRHSTVWIIGLAFSIAIVTAVFPSLAVFKAGVSLRLAAYLATWILLGGSCLVSAVHVWPFTIRKVAAYFSRSGRPSRPLNVNDATPLFLTISALIGVALLAYLTSREYALLVTSVVIVNALFRNLLRAPTRTGRARLIELKGFREFLSHADADRLDRENRPGKTPEILEKYIAYAVALKVERAWGEEFTANMLELLEFNWAYSFLNPKIPIKPLFGERDDDEPIELNLNSRK